MSRALRDWLPALLWIALIFALSSRSTLPISFDSGFDKLAHLAEYGVLGLLIAYGQARSALPAAAAVAAGSLVGALDEVYQSTVPGRMADAGDWIADTAGVFLGVCAYHQIHRWRGGRSTRARGSQPIINE